METTTTVTGWATQTPAEKTFSLFVFGLSTAVTVAFAYYLFAEPTRLVDIWEWSRSLHIVLQLGVWLLALPWMIALWVYTWPVALAVRLVLILGILGFTQFLMYPFK